MIVEEVYSANITEGNIIAKNAKVMVFVITVIYDIIARNVVAKVYVNTINTKQHAKSVVDQKYVSITEIGML